MYKFTVTCFPLCSACASCVTQYTCDNNNPADWDTTGLNDCLCSLGLGGTCPKKRRKRSSLLLTHANHTDRPVLDYMMLNALTLNEGDNQRTEEEKTEWNEETDTNMVNNDEDEERQNVSTWFDLIMSPVFGLFSYFTNINIPTIDFGFQLLNFDFEPFDSFQAQFFRTVYVTATVTC